MNTSPATNDQPAALGIIAGAGRFPYLVAEGARRRGIRVVIIALRGLAGPGLREVADRYYACGLVRLGRWIRLFRREGVAQAIMAGSVRKQEMYGRFRILRYLPDWSSIRVWYFRAADKRNDSILRATADFMAERGITLTDCVRYTPEQMAPAGVLTEVLPTASVERDVAFGWPIAKAIGRLDIGQAIAVKEQEVIAVEAIEGTDRLIRRAGELCKSKGWTLIKVAKPDQDMRFDVPTVGPHTLRNLAANGCTALVVEAGKTVIVDREQTVSLASSLGICIIGR
jgi:hypothetical protein